MSKFSKYVNQISSEIISTEKGLAWLNKKSGEEQTISDEPIPSEHSDAVKRLSISLGTAPGVSMSFPELFERVFNHIGEAFLFPSRAIQDHTAMYVIGSYLFDLHDSISYLGIEGTPGTGKTAFVKIMRALSYNSISLTGMDSEASFVRAIALVNGSVCLDEIQGTIHGGSSRLHKILTLGSQKPGVTVINEQQGRSGKWEPREFVIFGPKILAGYEISQHEAIRSRTYTIRTTKLKNSQSTQHKKITDDWRKKASAIKNDLLLYRQCRILGEQTESNLPEVNSDRLQQLDPRTLQVFNWLLAEAQTQEIFDRIWNSIIAHSDGLRKDREFDLDVVLLWDLHASICKGRLIFKQICEADAFKEHRIQSRELGSLHRRFNLPFKRFNGGTKTQATAQQVLTVLESLGVDTNITSPSSPSSSEGDQ